MVIRIDEARTDARDGDCELSDWQVKRTSLPQDLPVPLFIVRCLDLSHAAAFRNGETQVETLHSMCCKSRAINHDLAVACGDAFYFGGGDAPNADVRSTRPVLQRNDRIVAIAWGLRFENPGAIRQCHSFAPRGCCANCLSRPLDGRSRLAQGTRCRST